MGVLKQCSGRFKVISVDFVELLSSEFVVIFRMQEMSCFFNLISTFQSNVSSYICEMQFGRKL